MTISDISAKMNCIEYNKAPGHSSDLIGHITATDLMSEVLVEEEENLLLITALNTEQTIRTAHIVDAIGVLLVNGKIPQPGMIKLAQDFDLSLMATGESMFKTCAGVYSLQNGEKD